MPGSVKIKLPDFPIEGGCQCGSLRYRLSARPLTLYACHCTECQTQSSSAFGMSLRMAEEAVEIIGKIGVWERDKGRKTAVEGLFCTNCGSRVIHRRPGVRKTVNIKAGTLDDTSWLQPVGNLWTRSRQSWVVTDPDLLNFERQPENYDALIEAFSAAIR